MHHVSCRDFFSKTSNHPGDSAPSIAGLQLLAFPKTKITFEREEISDRWWDSEKYHGTANGNWENCVRSQRAYFEGDWGVIVLCTMFLVSCIFFRKCLYFSYYMAAYLLGRPRVRAERICREGMLKLIGLQAHWLTTQLSSAEANTSDKLHHNTLALYHFRSIHPIFLLPIKFYWRPPLCQQVCFHLGGAIYQRENKKARKPLTQKCCHTDWPSTLRLTELPSRGAELWKEGAFYAKWNKPVGERQIPHDLTYQRI